MVRALSLTRAPRLLPPPARGIPCSPLLHSSVPTTPPSAAPEPPPSRRAWPPLPTTGSTWSSTDRTAGGPTWSSRTPPPRSLDPSLHPELASAQVWLLSWLPEQGTPLHDHGWSAGAFAVVRGTLTERVVAAARHGRPVRQDAAQLTAGRVRHFGPHYVHQVTNEGAEPAISVHVYTPALLRMNTYSVVEGLLLHTGSERAGVDW